MLMVLLSYAVPGVLYIPVLPQAPACLIVDVTFDQTGYMITFASFVLGCPTFWLTTAY